MARKNKKSNDSKNEDLAKIKEERREMILETLSFLNSMRNQALFKISNAKLKKKIAEKELNAAKAQARMMKRRLISEIENNLELLKSGDTNDFFIEEENED